MFNRPYIDIVILDTKGYPFDNIWGCYNLKESFLKHKHRPGIVKIEEYDTEENCTMVYISIKKKQGQYLLEKFKEVLCNNCKHRVLRELISFKCNRLNFERVK